MISQGVELQSCNMVNVGGPSGGGWSLIMSHGQSRGGASVVVTWSVGVEPQSCHMVSQGAEPQLCHMVSGGGASVMSHGQTPVVMLAMLWSWDSAPCSVKQQQQQQL